MGVTERGGKKNYPNGTDTGAKPEEPPDSFKILFCAKGNEMSDNDLKEHKNCTVETGKCLAALAYNNQ